MSAWLASARKRHSFLVRLSLKRKKVVTTSAPQKKYGFSIFLLPITFRCPRGFSALQSWKSTGSSSDLAEHSVSSGRNCRSSGIVDFALDWTFLDSVGDFELLVSEWDRESSLGGEREREREREEREGSVRKKWGSGDWFGGSEVCFIGDSDWFNGRFFLLLWKRNVFRWRWRLFSRCLQFYLWLWPVLRFFTQFLFFFF